MKRAIWYLARLVIRNSHGLVMSVKGIMHLMVLNTIRLSQIYAWLYITVPIIAKWLIFVTFILLRIWVLRHYGHPNNIPKEARYAYFFCRGNVRNFPTNFGTKTST